jgi:hypothetical protein
LILAVHHEVQYLYFTYAMARRSTDSRAASRAEVAAMRQNISAQTANPRRQALRTEAVNAASFAVWPVIGFVGAIVGGWLHIEWLAPLGRGGLFCH